MQLSGLRCGHFLRGHQESQEGPLRVSRNITFFFCPKERYALPSFPQCCCNHLVSTWVCQTLEREHQQNGLQMQTAEGLEDLCGHSK